ncbi:hypothetical protein AN4538.2 [Aspergillus nidulans FGSC A4]|uniref:Uncharacterized protein n=1 Tax=Emericella nidulans (strain FGSC A4 / ATCC 38163 / CBS 112.46 / NRRL 194 / M139) TaxID=227321 RepID=Q5B4J2_EMENI|nr:hypothetical protein [Aspergillus nidulans FGSC A4]EAA60881.1 hypothetical protein AN4538.2 [Aspergillus nidulans FGSC A4]CBF77298.1 TPA: conserved hypothetical protein [Aspergillus nidulans FGSC A4]|eukprot:XP_662142.1 hypothetical protein AN4538.2 [Aspergillus nidulans FGSC A4]
MSADLFAEFGYAASASQPSQAACQQAVLTQDATLVPGLDSFEDATPSQLSPRHPHELKQPSSQPSFQNQLKQLDDFGDFELPQGGNNNDVLFDATLERCSDNGSDDWGDFESAEVTVGQLAQNPTSESVKSEKAVSKPVPKAPPNHNSASRSLGTPDLLGPMESITIQNKPMASGHQGNKKPGGTINRSNVQYTKPRLPVEDEPFEDWGDFSDGPTEASQNSNLEVPESQVSGKRKNLAQPSKATASLRAQTSKQSSSTVQVRPTNIPPPSILLELFPQLFERLRQEGTKAKRNLQQKDTLNSIAESITCTLKTVARIVAGRTLRWKRDSILSQSMRIGPARSGKAGGMKLSSVNRNEDIKEQQEAVDIINMWRDRASLFNSVVQAAGRRPVQVIPNNTRVIIATASQGALKAPHACALCGLKRDERIPKVDENVEDSFGEWWTEHWGHTECRQFWEDNKGSLGQR